MTDDDEELLARLRNAAADFDPPPDLVVDSARAALSTRRMDEELAALILDSELAEPGVVRAAGDEVRLLSFETARVTLELQVEPEGRTVCLRGLVSGAGGEAVVEAAGQRRAVPIDGAGWFTLTGLWHGALRVHLRAEDGGAVTTSWVLV